MTISVMSAAKRICQLSHWQVNHLKLQKILYLAHMMYMGKYDAEPLIDDLFVASDYGTIVPKLHQVIKLYGRDRISTGFYTTNPIALDSKEACEIKMATDHLLPKRLSQLVALTQRKSGAWEQHYLLGGYEMTIPNQAILAEYNFIFNRSR